MVFVGSGYGGYLIAIGGEEVSEILCSRIHAVDSSPVGADVDIVIAVLV